MRQQRSSGAEMALVAVLAACSPRDGAPRPDQVVALAATEYAFQAPDTLPAGWTTFRLANQGGEIHYGHIVQLDSGRTVQELVDAYAEAIRTSGPRPKWVRRFGGPGGTAPGETSSVTQFLEPGRHVWICPVEDTAGAPHFGKGEFKPFVVPAGAGGAGIAAIGPGMQSFLEADFPPGDDVLLCMATAPDGRSHIEHGMVRQISVRD